MNCMNSRLIRVLLLFLLGCSLLHLSFQTESEGKDKENKVPKKKKDIRDYTDADMERLFDEWEDNDEPLEEDELPQHKKKPPAIDLSKVDMSNPDNLLAASKKGRTLMMFVAVSGSPSRDETEKLTQLWQSSLFNANFEVQRFLVDDDRAIFMVNDGSKSLEIRDFLVQQERCRDVTIENQVFPGRGSPDWKGTKSTASESKKETKTKNTKDKTKKKTDKKAKDGKGKSKKEKKPKKAVDEL